MLAEDVTVDRVRPGGSMSRSVRLILSAVVLLAGLVAIDRPVAAQAAAPAAAVTPAQAAPFMGDWTVSLNGDMGPAVFNLSFSTVAGKVQAKVSSAQQAETVVTNITAQDKSLVLQYSFDYQGNDVPVTIVLTPNGDKVKADFDFANGAYTVSGPGEKKK
jgi:hypothetical protein